MRLLDAALLELKEFTDNEIPAYAILSHTWEKEEVSFQDMQSDRAKSKAGYSKIVGSCEQARSHRLQYIWIDACCIDKTSSTELTEAINSMYQWYQNAQVCFAYMSDVPSEGDILSEGSSFSKSRWFTRGWTLQELIAPSVVVFYSKDWRKLGVKTSERDGDVRNINMKRKISAITGVDVEVLAGRDPQSMSIAKRMSWASARMTTRKEDIAYCLMGLFGVNMPLLYGEGERAFVRLQEEIMKASDDHSLFAWRDTSDQASTDRYLLEERSIDSEYIPHRGLLATSPAEFIHSRNIVPFPSNHTNTPYSSTNRGLHIELLLLPYKSDIYTAVLNCTDITQHLGPLGIYLACLSPPNGDQFARVFPSELQPVGRVCGDCTLDILPTRTLYVRESLRVTQPLDSPIDHAYLFSIPKIPPGTGYYLSDVHPLWRWNSRDGILNLPSKSIGVAGVLLFEGLSDRKSSTTMPFMVIVAVNCNFCVSVRIEAGNDFKEAYERNILLLENDIKRRLKLEEPKMVLERDYHAESPPKNDSHSYAARDLLVCGDRTVAVGVEIESNTMSSPRNIFALRVTIV